MPAIAINLLAQEGGLDFRDIQIAIRDGWRDLGWFVVDVWRQILRMDPTAVALLIVIATLGTWYMFVRPRV